MIRPWLFEFVTAFQHHDAEHFDAERCAADYAWYLEQWCGAEDKGFEGIFFSEHHFVPGRYTPSPNLLIAAVAARTRRLRLGTMGNVVPLYEPWRLAEEFAMLDQLSGGRLEIGLATGSGPREFEQIGVRADELRSRFDEALEAIDALLTKPRASHRGRYWRFENLAIAPRPLQQPAPPRWITGVSEGAARSAATRGYRYCTGFLPIRAVTATFDAYRAAHAAAGHTTGYEGQLGLRRMVVLDEDHTAAAATGAEALASLRRILAGPPPASAVAGSVADAPASRGSGIMLPDEECIAGAPDAVAEDILTQCRACGAGHFLAYAPSTLSRAAAERNFALWARVNRILRAAGSTP